ILRFEFLMPQLFSKSANSLARASIIGSGAIAAVAVYMIFIGIPRSSYWNKTDIFKTQPVQFSHKHHVGDDGIDCRYCHTSVESSNFAGIPATENSMSCNSKIWSNAPMLE